MILWFYEAVRKGKNKQDKSAWLCMLAVNIIVLRIISTATAAHFPVETCKKWKTSHSSCYWCPCIDFFISAAIQSYFTCSTKSKSYPSAIFLCKGTWFRLEDLHTNGAERKWKEESLLFVKAVFYLHKIKLSSKLSLHRLRPWFANGIIMGSEHPRKGKNLFRERDVIENVSSGTVMGSKVCNH